jgi:ribonuclease HI
MPPKKFYAVWAGYKPGIYTTWTEAEKQVKGYPKAGYQSFSTRPLAEQAFAKGTASPSTPAFQDKSSAPPSITHVTATADVDIFCDGACNPNPGKSGTGIAIYKKQQLDQLWYGLHNRSGTNNTAELLGLYHSLIFAKAATENGQSVSVHCDSKYSIDCVTTWACGWKAKGWKKKGGEIKNLDIIKPAHALYLDIADKIQVLHVKGHAGIEGNELADRMSVIAIERQEAELRQYTDSLSIATILSMARG